MRRSRAMIVGPIVAPATAALQRLNLRELGLPEPQDVLRYVQLVGDLADRAEGVGSLLPAGHAPGPASSVSGRGQDPSSPPNSSSRRIVQPRSSPNKPTGSAVPFTWAFSTWLARNTSTRRGRIGTSTPVLGLRPIRSPFCPDGKRAEATDLDRLATCAEASAKPVEHRLEQIRRLVPRQADLRVDALSKMRACDGLHTGRLCGADCNRQPNRPGKRTGTKQDCDPCGARASGATALTTPIPRSARHPGLLARSRSPRFIRPSCQASARASGNGRGGGIRVPVHGDHHALLRQSQLAAHGCR